MRWLMRLVLAILALLGWKRRSEERERIVAPEQPDRDAESLVIVLLLAAAACAVLFVVLYADDGLANQTQWLGLSLGGALGLTAAALIVTGKRLVPEEENEEQYPEPHPEEQENLVQIVEESGSGITRKRLLKGAAGVAGTAVGVALVTPAASLGPVFDTEPLRSTPWRRGRRLVDRDGKPYRADDIEEGAFYTALPDEAEHETIGAPIVVIRLHPDQLDLPADRLDWAPQGILAYSKICTHAGCAISLYRKPLFEPVQPEPALACPCHYSTFDPATGGTVLFGPAGRPLPQLPLMIDAAGELRAAGDFSGPVGPSWSGVRQEPPS